MKFLRVLCVIALVAFCAVSAYAETQNVKVSGDLGVRGIFRDNFNLTGSFASQNEGSGATTTGRNGVDRPNSSWFMSTTEVQIDADLTDNVSTCVRLLNQRDWNTADQTSYLSGSQVSNPNVAGFGGFGHSTTYAGSNDEFGVDLELAYVTLKNFIYSPLTVSIGRQNLWFGKGFVVGQNQRITANQGLNAPEYTALNAFDSVKAVLDFDPWTLTGIYSKIWQNDVQSDDGVDLWGANVGYKFDAYKGEAEGYWFYKRDMQVEGWSGIKQPANDVHTIGLRGSFDPIDIITIYAEGALQAGNYMGNQLQVNNRSRMAGALDVGGELRYFTDKWAWKPKMGAEFIWYSGNTPEGAAAGNGQFHGWDPMFRGKSDSLIREYVGRYYYSTQYAFQTNRYYNSADASFQNQFQVILSGSLQPMDSLKLTGNLNMFANQYPYLSSFAKSGGYIGTEFDMGATWDYTEDVSFNLAMGYFLPGDVYKNTAPGGAPGSAVGSNLDMGNSPATDVVASVKVSF